MFFDLRGFVERLLVLFNLSVLDPAFSTPIGPISSEIIIQATDSRPSILSDIKHVLSQLTHDDLQKFFKAVLKEDLWAQIILPKLKLFPKVWNAIRAMPGLLVNLLKDPVGFFRVAFGNIISKVSEFLTKAKSTWNAMSGGQRAQFIISILVRLAVIAASAYVGQGIPDLDISILGIGKHRNFFTHSVMPVIAVELLAKITHRLIDGFKGKLPEDHHSIWSHLDNLKTVANDVTVGVYAGVSWHIFQDLFIDGSQSIRGPSFNTFINDTYVDDNAYLGIHLFDGLHSVGAESRRRYSSFATA